MTPPLRRTLFTLATWVESTRAYVQRHAPFFSTTVSSAPAEGLEAYVRQYGGLFPRSPSVSSQAEEELRAILNRPTACGRLLGLLDWVKHSRRVSSYTHHPLFDWRRGIYVGDCSQFVSWLVRLSNPRALEGMRRPMIVSHWVTHIQQADGPNTHRFLTRIRRLSEIEAGDILAWTTPGELPSHVSGHMGVAMERPHFYQDTPRGIQGYFVRLADFTSDAHQDDSRRNGSTGFGEGLMFFQADPETGEGIGYAWEGIHSLPERLLRTAITIGRVQDYPNEQRSLPAEDLFEEAPSRELTGLVQALNRFLVQQVFHRSEANPAMVRVYIETIEQTALQHQEEIGPELRFHLNRSLERAYEISMARKWARAEEEASLGKVEDTDLVLRSLRALIEERNRDLATFLSLSPISLEDYERRAAHLRHEALRQGVALAFRNASHTASIGDASETRRHLQLAWQYRLALLEAWSPRDEAWAAQIRRTLRIQVSANASPPGRDSGAPSNGAAESP